MVVLTCAWLSLTSVDTREGPTQEHSTPQAVSIVPVRTRIHDQITLFRTESIFAQGGGGGGGGVL